MAVDIEALLAEALEEHREGGGVLFPGDDPTKGRLWIVDDRFDLAAAARAFLDKVAVVVRVPERDGT